MGKKSLRECRSVDAEDTEEQTYSSEGQRANRDTDARPLENTTRPGETWEVVDASLQRTATSVSTTDSNTESRGINVNSRTATHQSSPDPEALSTRYDMVVHQHEAKTLQRLEDEFGLERVSRWADEGMTVKTMGKPRDMQAFRERQEQRPAEVPTDVERRNEASVQRSAKASRHEGPDGETDVPNSVRKVLSSPGQTLDRTIQRTMEDRMGEDFSDVQVHTGPEAGAACEDISARAFTVGNHVAFNRGEYDPSSPESQHVIAHELAHVRQQNTDISMLPQEGLALEIDPDPKLEQEAEETAQQVMSGRNPTIQCLRDDNVHIQRMDNDATPDGNTTDVDENKIRHIFGQPKHQLNDVVNYFGSEEEAFKEMKREVQSKADRGEISGVYEVTVTVGSYDVTVRGRVIDEEARIGTAWKES